MAKWECSVCGYIYDRDTPPERCPICKVPAEKFIKLGGGTTFVPSPVKGVAQKEELAMAKWVCSVCGYTFEGDNLPERCPVCKVLTDQFAKLEGATKHVSAPVAQQTATLRKGNPVQGISVVEINVVSENDIARMVQQEVNKEITNLNAQGKRVVNVSSGDSAKNIIGMKLHVILLWESDI